jgi:hypothetical protein
MRLVQIFGGEKVLNLHELTQNEKKQVNIKAKFFFGQEGNKADNENYQMSASNTWTA